MFVFALCLSLVIASSKAYPVEDIDFYPTGLQSNNLFDSNGYDAEPYPYQVPTNPYYVYDVTEGRWIPKRIASPAYVSVPSNVPQIIPTNGNHRHRANRRHGHSHSGNGHSKTFNALKGAIAFG